METESGFASAHEMANSPTVTFGGTREGVILGTAAYMAPEQARGGAIDKRADIWAFGVVLYEMLTAERLFAEGSVVDTLSAVMRKPIDLDRLPATTPAALRRLLARCLEREPRQRLRDIGEARLALEALGSGAGVEGHVEAMPAPSGRSSSLGLGVAIAVASVVAGALLGAAIAGRMRRPAEAEPIRIHPLTYSGADSDPAASPDGKLVAFTSRRDGISRIWIRQLVGGGEEPLTSGPDGHARFSPDGSSLLFVRDLGTSQAVFRTALVGGEPRRLVDNATAADWSPDGRRIVFARTREAERSVAQIGTLDLATGRERILVDLGDRLLHSPRWSPDGRLIAIRLRHFLRGGLGAADGRRGERTRDRHPAREGGVRDGRHRMVGIRTDALLRAVARRDGRSDRIGQRREELRRLFGRSSDAVLERRACRSSTPRSPKSRSSMCSPPAA